MDALPSTNGSNGRNPDRVAIEAARLHAAWLRAQTDECTAQVAFPFGSITELAS